MRNDIKFLCVAALVSAVAFFTPQEVSAQSKTGEISYSKGQDLQSALSDTVVFALREFSDGRVFFKDMSSYSAKLNISNLEQCVKFIDPAGGDTLNVANESEIAYVIAANKTFYKTRFGYAQVLKYSGSCLFCFVKDLSVEQLQSMTSYGRIPATSTAKTVNALNDIAGANSGNVGKNMDLKYNMRLLPVLINGNKVMVSTRKAFMKAFPDKKDHIKQLAQETKTDFGDVVSAYNFFNILTGQE